MMSPRALVESGRKGIGREVFPESAKELGRREGLVAELVTILRFTAVSDGGGDTIKTYVPEPPPIRGRLRPTRYRLPHQAPIGGHVNETSTHLVELDPDVKITTNDRLEIEGQVYLILSLEPDTQGPFLQLEVKEL